MIPLSLAQELKVFGALKPAADAAGRSGRYFSLKNLHKGYFIALVDQGNAATIALTLGQAQDVAGTNAKAITALVPIWANLDPATDALVRAADAASYTTDAGVKEKIVIVEIRPEHLDMANGFDCVRLTTGASNAANITSAFFVGVPRYPGDGGPSIITD
jgi:hypothetical protein